MPFLRVILFAMLGVILTGHSPLPAAPHEPSPAGGDWLDFHSELSVVQSEGPWFPALTAFKQITDMGFQTCDSVSTIKAGAYGNILMPYMKGVVRCSDRDPSSITEDELRALQAQYEHVCPYCDNYHELTTDRQARMKHNMIVMDELSRLYKDDPIVKGDGQMSLL